jgi:DNA-binding Xre family transcriptional regulator
MNLAKQNRTSDIQPMIGEFGMAVRFRLSAILETVGMSQSELARRSKVSYVTINAMANNRTKQVSLATLDAICGALDVAPGDLLERDAKRGRKG